MKWSVIAVLIISVLGVCIFAWFSYASKTVHEYDGTITVTATVDNGKGSESVQRKTAILLCKYTPSIFKKEASLVDSIHTWFQLDLALLQQLIFCETSEPIVFPVDKDTRFVYLLDPIVLEPKTSNIFSRVFFPEHSLAVANNYQGLLRPGTDAYLESNNSTIQKHPFVQEALNGPWVRTDVPYMNEIHYKIEVESKIVFNDLILENIGRRDQIQDYERLDEYNVRRGSTITTTYNQDYPMLAFGPVDVNSFGPIEAIANGGFSPVVDGGYKNRLYSDKGNVYCMPGKGIPKAISVRLDPDKPFELVFNELSTAFDTSDGLSELERSAWKNKTGEYGGLYFKDRYGYLYSVNDCTQS